MLVLGRKVGESIMIAANIKIQIVMVRRDHVVLGIDAPKYVAVDREEIAIAKQLNVEGAA